MAGVIALLGGVRATVFAALALLALSVAGVQSYRLNTAQKAMAILAAKWAQADTERAHALTQSALDALDAEHTRAKAVNAAATAYEQGKQDGQAADAALRDAVDDGRLVLRDKFRCPAAAAGVSDPPARAGVGNGAGAAIFSAADQQFLVRIGNEADDIARRLNACQAVITAYQQLITTTRQR